MVELMVVVAITAMIAGFTVAEINSTSHKLKSTSRTLRAKMQQARLFAVKESCNVFVDFDLDGGGIDPSYTLWRDADNNNTYAASELIETVILPVNISFGAVTSSNGGPSKSASGTTSIPSTSIISFSGDRVRFSPQGTASNGWAYLHAPNKDSAGTYAVGSNNVGKIKSSYWATNSGAWR